MTRSIPREMGPMVEAFPVCTDTRRRGMLRDIPVGTNRGLATDGSE